MYMKEKKIKRLSEKDREEKLRIDQNNFLLGIIEKIKKDLLLRGKI